MHYSELSVWQKSMDVVTLVYGLTIHFPAYERYGLSSQLQRAAVSIPSNIAEGSRRRGGDSRQLFTIAFASGAEVETQLEIARRLGYGSPDEITHFLSIHNDVMRMLNRMAYGST